MSALEDIRKGLDEFRNRPRMLSQPTRCKIVVGHAAELSIRAETAGHAFPLMIDGCAVERTKNFPGWELVEI